jgi:hypothetical protein
MVVCALCVADVAGGQGMILDMVANKVAGPIVNKMFECGMIP